MTPLSLANSIGVCCALAVLGVMMVYLFAVVGRELWRRGKSAAIFLGVMAIVTSIIAQKPPPVAKEMHLTIDNVTATGFDLSWDYGNLTPADFQDGETVKITARLKSMDYNLLVGTLPVTVTNYHVNCVNSGLPRDWMRYDLDVTARCNNLLGHDGIVGDAAEVPRSINDAGGDE